jgi:hypothetical protein
MPEVE